MADLKTTVTELVTGLGMLGHDSIEAALRARPREMVSVSPEQWTTLQSAYDGGALAREFGAAFANGRDFLGASEGLRGRLPRTVEWKGAQSNPGDEALPVDLRIDHVYLISCKYLSKIVHNASPIRVFENSLRSSRTLRSCDWFADVAPVEYQQLYERTVDACGAAGMPVKAVELTSSERQMLREQFPPHWRADVEAAYASLCTTVSSVSAERWLSALDAKPEQEATLWRLLRLGPAPYFVLGSSRSEALRLRIATPWDWRQQYVLQKLTVEPKPGGQPMVGWSATVKDRHTSNAIEVNGHVEIRWSHGRFGGRPEAKVYLDTPHSKVPGYYELS